MKKEVFIANLFALLTTHFSIQKYWIAITAGNWINSANWFATSGGVGPASAPSAAANVFVYGAEGANGNFRVTSSVSNNHSIVAPQSRCAISRAQPSGLIERSPFLPKGVFQRTGLNVSSYGITCVAENKMFLAPSC